MRYSIDAMVGMRNLTMVKTDSLAQAYKVFANAIDFVENGEALNISIFDEERDYEVIASVWNYDL